jgi:hypothetical protein
MTPFVVADLASERSLIRATWLNWSRVRYQRSLERAKQRLLAQQLHLSNAWHCGCWRCVALRELNHGDGPRRLPQGLTLRTRRVLGVDVETVQVTEAARRRLR